MGYVLNNRILIGDRDAPALTLGNSTLVEDSLAGVSGADVIGNELSVDTFSFTVRIPDARLVYGTAGGLAYRMRNGTYYGLGKDTSYVELIEDVEYGTPVWWYIYDEDGEEKYFVNGFVKSVDRDNSDSELYKFTCMSAIGLLDSKIHKGGMYNAQLQSILAEVIGDTFPYTVEQTLKKIVVPGWLPYGPARENLHLLLFSVGANIVRDSTQAGRYRIQILESKLHELDADKISFDSSIKRELPATRVEVIEHSFAELSSDEEVTLYDNTAAIIGANNVTVVFEAPMHDLTWNGEPFTGEHNCNYAVVSGVGTLVGKRTTHITREVVIDNTPEGSKPRTVRVDSNCLVNPLNSNNVAKRLMAYYGSCRRFKGKAILGIGNKAGQNFSLLPAFFGSENAFLEQMAYDITSVVGADCSWVAGYVPAYVGNNFTHVEVLDTDGDTFEFTPTGANELIRLVVIGSGSGGSGGWGGQIGCGYIRTRHTLGASQPGTMGIDVIPSGPYEGAGGWTYDIKGQEVREGGKPGAPGAAGKIFIIDLEISGPTVITAGITQGGAGGAGAIAEHYNNTILDYKEEIPPKDGKKGAETVCTVETVVNGITVTTAYSSENGAVSASGFFDPINEVAYALPGVAGTQGGAGGWSDSNPYIDHSGSRYYAVGPGGWSGFPGKKGGDVAGNVGGLGGAGVRIVDDISITVYGQTLTYGVSGGGGGGAAYGVDGSPGGDAYYDKQPGFWPSIRGGKGGDGATPLAPAVPSPGSGGGAGHGGGSGGSVGGMFARYFADYADENQWRPGIWGNAGDGGTGGRGGPGIVLVYHSMTL